MNQQNETDTQVEKKSKRKAVETASVPTAAPAETSETKVTVKITFEGDAAQRILRCEADLKERLSKPDMGRILGNEIVTWTDKRWTEIVEENTDMDYFFAQIRKCSDKSKSLKLLKALAEKLKSESSEVTTVPLGLATSLTEEAHGNSAAERHSTL